MMTPGTAVTGGVTAAYVGHAVPSWLIGGLSKLAEKTALGPMPPDAQAELAGFVAAVLAIPVMFGIWWLSNRLAVPTPAAPTMETKP